MKSLSVLIVFVCLQLQATSAQSITEKLGGVKTEFKFYSDSLDLEVNDQMIMVSFKFGSFIYFGPGDVPQTYRQEFSYQSYSLEFTSRKEIFIDNQMVTRKTFETYKLKHYFEFLMFDESGKMVAAFTLPDYRITSTINNLTDPSEKLFCYSVDLSEIPLLLLNRTSIIKIKEIKIVQW